MCAHSRTCILDKKSRHGQNLKGTMTISSRHKETTQELDYDVDELSEQGINVKVVKRGKISPLMTDGKDLHEVAKDVAAFIESQDRQPMYFDQFASQFDPHFVPDCDFDSNIIDIDTGSHSKQAGHMDVDTANKVIETKLHCAECPLQRECLAISLTGIQITRISRSERVLPRRPGDVDTPILVMDDFLIFGGLTPQERRIVFHDVCDILEENNRDFEV